MHYPIMSNVPTSSHSLDALGRWDCRASVSFRRWASIIVFGYNFVRTLSVQGDYSLMSWIKASGFTLALEAMFPSKAPTG